MTQEMHHFSENFVYSSPPVSLRFGQGTKSKKDLRFVKMIH